MKEYANNTVLKLSQIMSEVNSGAEALSERLRGSEHDGAVAVAGRERAGRGRGGDQRVDRTDDGVDLAEHRERQGHRRHGDQGGERSGRRRRGGQGDRGRR